MSALRRPYLLSAILLGGLAFFVAAAYYESHRAPRPPRQAPSAPAPSAQPPEMPKPASPPSETPQTGPAGPAPAIQPPSDNEPRRAEIDEYNHRLGALNQRIRAYRNQPIFTNYLNLYEKTIIPLAADGEAALKSLRAARAEPPPEWDQPEVKHALAVDLAWCYAGVARELLDASRTGQIPLSDPEAKRFQKIVDAAARSDANPFPQDSPGDWLYRSRLGRDVVQFTRYLDRRLTRLPEELEDEAQALETLRGQLVQSTSSETSLPEHEDTFMHDLDHAHTRLEETQSEIRNRTSGEE